MAEQLELFEAVTGTDAHIDRYAFLRIAADYTDKILSGDTVSIGGEVVNVGDEFYLICTHIDADGVSIGLRKRGT